MIPGIPYLGENHNEIIHDVLMRDIDSHRDFESLYDLMQESLKYDRLLIIDDEWTTWMNDITFNYRDKQVYIPYYKYMLYQANSDMVKNDNKGHLLYTGNTLLIRYDYEITKLVVDINNIAFVVYDRVCDEKQLWTVSSKLWTTRERFNINELYQLYIDSCYEQDDLMFNKHLGGYHYIMKSPDKAVNKERIIRELLSLNTYKDNKTPNEADYRDVRNFKYNEVVKHVGFRDTISLYRTRRLTFEVELYCMIRQNIPPCGDNTFCNEWKELGVSKEYIKFGENIKLIFKAYWLDKFKQIPKRTWSMI